MGEEGDLINLFFKFTFAMHITEGRLFRNIQSSLQYSSRSLIHASCMIFSHMYILHYASFPWSQRAQFSFLGFIQLNVSEPELIFKYHGQWKEGVSLFVHIYTHFRY